MNKAKAETKPSADKSKAREVLFFELEYAAVNGRDLIFEALKQTLKGKGFDVTPALFARCGLFSKPRKSIQSVIEASGQTAAASEQLADQAEAVLMKAFVESAKLNKDLPALIKAAHERNIQTVALSVLPEPVARDLMKKTGLDELGVDLVAMDSTDPVFPRADHWLRILKQRGQDMIPLIAVVSSRIACKGALTAGATCIALPDTHTSFEDFTGAKVVLNALGDMPVQELLNLVCRR